MGNNLKNSLAGKQFASNSKTNAYFSKLDNSSFMGLKFNNCWTKSINLKGGYVEKTKIK